MGTDADPEEEQATALCPFQREIFADFVPESGLLVMAKGLGFFHLLCTFVELYTVPELLVLILGATPQQEAILQRHYTAGLEELVGKAFFKIIKNDTAAPKRAEMYLHGGVISITSRIMLIDLLRERLPAHIVTGVIVLDAERVTEFSTEAFILDLYRERNSEGFVKAFSQSAESLVGGFNKIEKMLKFLKTPKLFLLPRFHATVKEDLDEVVLDVEELQVALTPKMNLIQLGLMEALETCLRELIQANPTVLDDIQFTPGNALSATFGVQIRRQLDPIWHRISLKSKQLVGELETLRLLLEYLTAFDAISYLRLIETILVADFSTPGSGGFRSNWLLLDVAHAVIRVARERVFKCNDGGEICAESSTNIEMLPKWKALQKLLHTPEESASKKQRVLVMVQEEHTRRHLTSLLRLGEDGWKKIRIAEYLNWRKKARVLGGLATGVAASVNPMPTKRPRRYLSSSLSSSSSSSSSSTPAANQDAFVEAANTNIPEEHSLIEEIIEATTMEEEIEEENVIIRSYNDGQFVDYEQMLHQLQPDMVILYDNNLAFLRAIEMHCLRWGPQPEIIRILQYKESVEEQRQLVEIRQEKDAFEQLIKAKAAMAPLSTTSVKVEPDAEGAMRFLGWEESLPRKIVVDLRELRSSLPFILYRQGFQLDPRTINVGDYILTPKRCVERKSVSDLISSLNNGRLYSQVEAMQRQYDTPILLIEFDENRPFTLLPGDTLRADISITDISSKLCLLLLHFPRLRIIWSSSLAGTADIFRELKRDEPEPFTDIPGDPNLSADNISDPTAYDILQSLPGINASNCYLVMRHVRNLRELARQTLADLTDLLGGEAARKLYTFLHEPIDTTDISSSSNDGKNNIKRTGVSSS